MAETIGEQIRRLREAAGLRQDDVARRAKLRGLPWNSATVAAIETNRRDLSLDEFQTIRGQEARDDELAAMFTLAVPTLAITGHAPTVVVAPSPAHTPPVPNVDESDAELKAARRTIGRWTRA